MGKVADAIRKSLGGFGNLGVLPFAAGFFGITGYTLYNGIYFVPGGYAAVKFNAITGLQNKTYGEGAHLALPYIETPVVMSIRNRPTEVTTQSGSRDLQMISMAVRVLYKPQEANLHLIYRNLGVDFDEKVLPSLINEIIKSVIAQFNASELLTKRPEVSSRISALLKERARYFHIDISDVAITQMSFGKEYTAAVEAKQVAQQMAERAKFRVEQALQEKRGAIVLAEGEAQAAKLIGDSIQNNPGFVELRRIEAAKQIAKAVATGQGKAYIDSDVLMLNLTDPQGAARLVETVSPNTGKKK
jgi:prohibitin 2